jgi:hypothetical protein
MPDKKRIEPGPIGVVVAQNLENLCKYGRISYAELSRRLDALGRPIAPLGLTRIRDLERRVDVDDLIALSMALGVSPVALLVPWRRSRDAKVKVTDSGARYTREQLRAWVSGERPIDAKPGPEEVEPIQVFIKRKGEPPMEVAPITDEQTINAILSFDPEQDDGDD